MNIFYDILILLCIVLNLYNMVYTDMAFSLDNIKLSVVHPGETRGTITDIHRIGFHHIHMCPPTLLDVTILPYLPYF